MPLVHPVHIDITVPISTDRFEQLDEEGDAPASGTNADEILTFLAANPETAFTRSEIIEATDVAANSVGPTLVRLREAGRVDHRGQYWRISDHERALDAAVGHAGAVAESHEDTSFDDEAWRQHAVDPREDRES